MSFRGMTSYAGCLGWLSQEFSSQQQENYWRDLTTQCRHRRTQAPVQPPYPSNEGWMKPRGGLWMSMLRLALGANQGRYDAQIRRRTRGGQEVGHGHFSDRYHSSVWTCLDQKSRDLGIHPGHEIYSWNYVSVKINHTKWSTYQAFTMIIVPLGTKYPSYMSSFSDWRGAPEGKATRFFSMPKRFACLIGKEEAHR